MQTLSALCTEGQHGSVCRVNLAFCCIMANMPAPEAVALEMLFKILPQGVSILGQVRSIFRPGFYKLAFPVLSTLLLELLLGLILLLLLLWLILLSRLLLWLLLFLLLLSTLLLLLGALLLGELLHLLHWLLHGYSMYLGVVRLMDVVRGHCKECCDLLVLAF